MVGFSTACLYAHMERTHVEDGDTRPAKGSALLGIGAYKQVIAKAQRKEQIDRDDNPSKLI